MSTLMGQSDIIRLQIVDRGYVSRDACTLYRLEIRLFRPFIGYDVMNLGNVEHFTECTHPELSVIHEQNGLRSPPCHNLFYTGDSSRRFVGAILWQEAFCTKKGTIDEERLCHFIRLRPGKRKSERMVFATDPNDGVVALA